MVTGTWPQKSLLEIAPNKPQQSSICSAILNPSELRSRPSLLGGIAPSIFQLFRQINGSTTGTKFRFLAIADGQKPGKTTSAANSDRIYPSRSKAFFLIRESASFALSLAQIFTDRDDFINLECRSFYKPLNSCPKYSCIWQTHIVLPTFQPLFPFEACYHLARSQLASSVVTQSLSSLSAR